MAQPRGHGDHQYRDILGDVATPNLYRLNAFRVLGLSVTVDGAEMIREQKKLKMLEKLGGGVSANPTGVLPPIPPPDAEALRRAGQRLHDLQSRLVDEIFWFWPTSRATNHKTDGLARLRAGDISGAHQAWYGVSSKHADWPAARHNLAVLHHALALDLECQRNGSKNVDSRVQERLELHWNLALSNWVHIIDHESVWTHVRLRAEVLDDPRLTSGYVMRLRQSLPAAILSISASLAVRAAKRGDAMEARSHLIHIRKSGFDLNLAASVLEQEASPLVDQVRRICEPVSERSRVAPGTSHLLASNVLGDCYVVLAGIRAILGNEHHLQQTAFDLVASTVRGCMIDYGNSTEDWDACISTLRQAEELALDDALKSQITEDIAQVKENKKAKENEHALKLLHESMEAAKSGRPDDGRRLLYEALAACRDPDLKKQITSFIREVDSVRRTVPQRSDPPGCLAALLGRMTAIAVYLISTVALILLIAGIGGTINSCDKRPALNSRPFRSSNPTWNSSSPRPSSPTPTLSALPGKIDSGKARARALEAELRGADSDLESLSASSTRYKREIEGFERQASSGLRIDQYAYEQALEAYNRLVGQHNSLLASRNAKYETYKREIDLINDLVNRYNRGER